MSEPAEDYATAKLEDDDLDELTFGRRRGPVWRWVSRLIFFVLIALALASLARLLFTKTVLTPDGSMYPTVEQGSSLMVLKGQSASPGDLVLLELDRGPVLRRVLAGPGQTIGQTRDGLVVDGELLAREAVGEHEWFHVSAPDDDSAPESGIVHTCDEVRETIAGRAVSLCIGGGSERPHEEIELAEGELYVRCDNRAFCARRRAREGPVEASRVRGRALFLMGTRNDDDQPFYKRWFGLFESIDD